jgi:hypothetical protein
MSRQDYLPLIILRSLFWTMKYGLCEFSGSPFSCMGIIFSSLGDLQTAKAYARHANIIIDCERVDSRRIKSSVLHSSHCFSLHWTNPLQSMLKPLLKGYEIGMQTGETECAGWGIYHYILVAFQASRPLEALANDGRVYSRQFDELDKVKVYTYLNLTWQLCLNPMGCADNPLILTGEAMDEEDCKKRAAGKLQHLLPLLQSHQIILYGFFGAYDRCAELALQVGDLTKEIPGSPLVAMCACMNGLSLCAMARKTKQWKYKRAAKKFITKIKTWIERGNPNLKQWDILLDAEWAALNGKKHIAKKNYEVAIIIAARSGYLQDAGLASERFGEYLLSELDEKDEGIYRIQNALRYFDDWGAKGKVESLEKRYEWIMPKPDVITTHKIG